MALVTAPLIPVGTKPTPGSWAGPSSVDPKWRWAWQNLIMAVPFWEGAGIPTAYGSHGQALTLENATGVSWSVTPGEFYNPTGLPQARIDSGRLRYDITGLNGDVAGTMFLANYLKALQDKHFNVYHCEDAFGSGQVVLESVTGGGVNDYRFLGVDSTDNAVAGESVTLAGIRSVGGGGYIVRDGVAQSVSSLNNWDNSWGTNIQFGADQTDTTGTGPLPTAFYFWSDAKTPEQMAMLHDDPWGPFRAVQTVGIKAAGGGPQTLTQSAPVGLNATIPTHTISGSGAATLTQSAPVVLNATLPTHSISGSGAVSLTQSAPVGLVFNFPTATIAASTQLVQASPVVLNLTVPTHTISGSGVATLTQANPAALVLTVPTHAISGSGAVTVTQGSPVGLVLTIPAGTIAISAAFSPTVISGTGSVGQVSGTGSAGTITGTGGV